MRGEEHPAKVEVKKARERVLERLSEAFARDELGLEEFEQRVDDAYRADGVTELESLVGDLEPRAGGAPLGARLAPASDTALVPAEPSSLALAPAAPPRPYVRAILGNVERVGRFELTDGYRVVSVLGNVEIDLRDAILPGGETLVHVRAVLGNVEITVPPDLAVQCEGDTVLGSFSAVQRIPPEGGHGPLLRIVGSAILGNVEVHTRPRGAPNRPSPRRLRG